MAQATSVQTADTLSRPLLLCPDRWYSAHQRRSKNQQS